MQQIYVEELIKCVQQHIEEKIRMLAIELENFVEREEISVLVNI